jgi:hypothetical protein
VCIFQNDDLNFSFHANTPETLLYRSENGTGLVCLPVEVFPAHRVSVVNHIFQLFFSFRLKIPNLDYNQITGYGV